MPKASIKPLRQTLLRLAATLAIVLAAVLAPVVWAALRTPAWFTPRPMGDAEVARAEGVERRVLSELSAAHRLGEPWTLSITAPEAEAWLNVRLPVWMENQNAPRPTWFGFVALAFDNRQVRAGLGTGTGGTPPVISMTITPPKTTGAAPEHTARLGILPVPGWIIEQVAPGLNEQIEQAISKRSASRPGTSTEPPGMGTIRLDDGRRVRFTGFDAKSGTLTLHCVTLGKP